MSNNCLYCEKETPNPKFCSNSCSASYHNRIKPKRKKQNVYDNECLHCGKKRTANYTGKYCSRSCQQKFQSAELIKSWLSGEWDGNGKYGLSKPIRRYLIEKFNNSCQECEWSEVNIYTNLVPLQIDHVDGDFQNNRPENLKVLCPNCHSLTSTFGSLNNGNGRSYRYKSRLP